MWESDDNLILIELFYYINGCTRTEIRNMGYTTWFVQTALKKAGVKEQNRRAVAKGHNKREERIANGNAIQRDARLFASRALGRKLTRREIVHHVDLDKTNNQNNNLLICSLEYHGWLHAEIKRQWYIKTFEPRIKKMWKKGYSSRMIARRIPELKRRMIEKILGEYLGLQRSQLEVQRLRFNRGK